MDPDYTKKYFTRTGSLIMNIYVKNRPFRIEFIHKPGKALNEEEAKAELMGMSQALMQTVSHVTGVENNIFDNIEYVNGVGTVSVTGCSKHQNSDNRAQFLLPTEGFKRRMG